MKIIDVDQNSPEWLEARKNKITGSKLADVLPKKRGAGLKIGFYQLVADRLAIEDNSERPDERGHSLEFEALAEFSKLTGKKTKQVGLCVSDLHENIAVSPDALIPDADGLFSEAVEIKCLSSARHIEAMCENKVPSEYYEQVVQYFIVNDDLKKLYFVFYDPRIAARPMFWIEVTREEVQEDIEEFTKAQIQILKDVEELAEKIIFNTL